MCLKTMWYRLSEKRRDHYRQEIRESSEKKCSSKQPFKDVWGPCKERRRAVHISKTRRASWQDLQSGAEKCSHCHHQLGLPWQNDTDWVAQTQRYLSLIGLEAGKSMIKVAANLVSGWGSLPGTHVSEQVVDVIKREQSSETFIESCGVSTSSEQGHVVRENTQSHRTRSYLKGKEWPRKNVNMRSG